jgi:hypothetical protein
MGQLLVYVPITAIAGVIYLRSADISGWFVLAFSTVMAIFFLIKSFTRYSAVRKGEQIVEGELLLISYAPFATSLILIAVLVLLFVDVSKLHLLWFAPLSYVVFNIIFARRMVNVLDGNRHPRYAVSTPDNLQKERQTTQPTSATDPHKEYPQSGTGGDIKSTEPVPRNDRTPVEQQWDKVIWAMRRTKNRKYVVGPILRNVETPEPDGGKIALRFKSNALKNNFMEEMQDQRSRDALKAAITDAYGSEFELQVISPHEADEKKYPSVMDVWHFEHEPSNSLAALAASTTKYANQVLDGTYEIVGGVMDLESLPPDQEWYLMLEAIGYSMECLNLATYSVGGPDYRHYAMNNIEMFVSAQMADRYFNLRSPKAAEQSKSTLLSAGNDIGQRLSGIYQRYEQALSEMGTDYAESIEGALGKTYIQQVDLIIETPAGESIFRNIDAKMRFQITLAAATLDCEMDKYAELGVSDFEKLESSDEKA